MIASMSHNASNEFDPREFRNAMGKFATGICVFGYYRDGEPCGLTANAFMSVSLSPPLVTVSVRNESAVLRNVTLGTRHGISMLASDQRPVSDQFGGRPQADAVMRLDETRGVPLVPGALATLCACVEDLHVAGDHTLVISRVTDFQISEGNPLLYFGGAYCHLQAL